MKLFSDDYKMSAFSEFLWRLAFAAYFKGLYNCKVYDQHKLPKEGAYIVAANHMSNFDPPLLGLAVTRPVYVMAKAELFKINPLFTLLIKWLGSFPVNRGAVDKIAIRRAMNILKRGDLLGIFPQGGRRKAGTFDRLHDGAASFALRTGNGIIPVAIYGSEKLLRNKVGVKIGNIIPVEKAKPTPEAIQTVNDQLSKALERLYREIEADLT